MQILPGYEIRRALWTSGGLTAHEAVRHADGNRVLAVFWEAGTGQWADEADPNWRACRIAAILNDEDFPSTATHHPVRGGSWCVHDWFDGLPLSSRGDAAATDLQGALSTAAAVARLLARLHGADMVHGALSPSSILRSPPDERVRLADLGYVSLAALPGLEHPDAQTPEKLLYQSPEGTGRLGIPVDDRSDLYALGAVLFELLVGGPPFPMDTPLEIIHAHLARAPAPPHELVPGVPPAVSRIVLKLLAKLPEERYRSAQGVAFDLQQCLRSLSATGAVSGKLVLATRDVPSRLRLSRRLYGRAGEEAVLAAAFDARQRQPGRTLALVSGYAGIGKTSLVEALRRRAVVADAFFAAGKFEQRTMHQPFVGIASGLRHLCRQVLAMPAADLEEWKSRLQSALGQRIGLLTELVPELRLLSPGPVQAWDVAAHEARWWFVDACRRLLRAYVGPSSPLVLFLDDVHWMDRASKELLDELLGDRRIANLLVVAAYRSEEVDDGSPLDDLIRDPPAVDRVCVELQPLDLDDIAQLLEESLVRMRPASGRVAEVLARKTGGNPLELRRLIESLPSRGLLRFRAEVWDWDLQTVDAVNVTDGRGRRLATTLEGYSTPVREVLCRLACLGGEVGLDLLAAACTMPPARCAHALREPVEDGLVLRIGGAHGNRYRFSHDRIAEEAYLSIDEHARRRRHGEIACILHAAPALAADRPFAVVEQLDRAGRRPEALSEREIAQVYLRAAESARDNTAFEAAHAYLLRSAEFHGAHAWEDDYASCMRWHQLSAEVAYQQGHDARSRSLIYDALEHARDIEDIASLYCMLIVQNTRVGLDQEAIDQGMRALSELGFELPRRPYEAALARERDALERIDIETEYRRLLDLPRSHDPRYVKTMQILMELLPPTFFKEPILNQIIATRMTALSLERGIAPASPKGIVNYGAVLAEHGRFREGYLFGRLAVDLADRHGLARTKPRVLYTLAGGLNHWVNHLRTTPAIVDEGVRLSAEHGERDYGAYLLTLGRCQNEYFLGNDRIAFREQVRDVLEHVEEIGNALSTGLATAAYLGLCHLTGETEQPLSFDHGEYREQSLLESSSAPRRRLVDCFFHLVKAHNLYFLAQYDAARDALENARRTSPYMAAPIGLAMLELFSALLLAEALARQARDSAPAGETLASIRRAIERMDAWAQDCPENFAHCADLLHGARCVIEGEHEAALVRFTAAVQGARRNDYLQFEGLAHERIAELWHARSQPYYVRHHLVEAIRCYERWGAPPVVRRVQARIESLGADTQPPAPGPGHAPLAAAAPDVAAIVDMMRRISGELGDFEALKREMARTVAQVAGAQRAMLLLREGEALAPALAIDASGEPAPLRPAAYPSGLVRLAARTGELVVVEDGVSTDAIGREPYLEAERPRSAMALALKHRGEVEGVVYLENRINRMDSSPARVELLSVLASQAALSVRNAALYGGLEAQVRERTRELRVINEGLEQRVNRQAEEIAGLRRFGRFLSPNVAAELAAKGGEQRLEHHRREIAVIFCDLRGFSAYSGSVAPEDLYRMQRAYRMTVDGLFARHDATVDHWAGDGAMAFLGDPLPVDPPARAIHQAVDLAVELRASVEELVRGWRAHGHALGFGIGVAYGWATMDLWGGDWRMDYQATGLYVNLADRLCDAAQHGQILVTKRVAAEVRSRYPVVHVDTIRPKGFAEEVEIHDVARRDSRPETERLDEADHRAG